MEHGVVRSVEDGVKNNLRVAFDRFSLLPGVELKDVYTLSWTVLNGTKYTVDGHLMISVSENSCLLYTSPSPRDKRQSRMPSSA